MQPDIPQGRKRPAQPVYLRNSITQLFFVMKHISFRKFETHDKDACLIAFNSNVPRFFALHEVSLFDNFLDHIDDQHINDKYFEKTRFYVIESDGQLVGCGGFGYNKEPDEVILAWGLIHRGFHRQGLGNELLTYRLQRIKEYYPTADVRIDTTQFSAPFFEKHGFVTTKVTPDYYAAGMHRYDMVLNRTPTKPTCKNLYF